MSRMSMSMFTRQFDALLPLPELAVFMPKPPPWQLQPAKAPPKPPSW